jgi:hypothetical protein
MYVWYIRAPDHHLRVLQLPPLHAYDCRFVNVVEFEFTGSELQGDVGRRQGGVSEFAAHMLELMVWWDFHMASCLFSCTKLTSIDV